MPGQLHGGSNPAAPTAQAALRKVLLVDDDRTLCDVLARALERKGFKVSSAHDYHGALAAAVNDGPQFAVVDLRFPGGSGLHLVSRLIQRDQAMRIIMLTGFASIATAVEAVKLGAHQYLTKPANADEIVAAFDSERPAARAVESRKPLSVNRLEWEHINRVLAEHKGNISRTARTLGMHRRTLQRKLAKHPARS